mmetsp:Transcript_31544/g.84391  ORF Transcript_31544/g.84391 Transcript_31544/m.84391 type:complete len:412 (+) Transcript_31544:863-2098(+)
MTWWYFSSACSARIFHLWSSSSGAWAPTTSSSTRLTFTSSFSLARRSPCSLCSSRCDSWVDFCRTLRCRSSSSCCICEPYAFSSRSREISSACWPIVAADFSSCDLMEETCDSFPIFSSSSCAWSLLTLASSSWELEAWWIVSSWVDSSSVLSLAFSMWSRLISSSRPWVSDLSPRSSASPISEPVGCLSISSPSWASLNCCFSISNSWRWFIRVFRPPGSMLGLAPPSVGSGCGRSACPVPCSLMGRSADASEGLTWLCDLSALPSGPLPGGAGAGTPLSSMRARISDRSELIACVLSMLPPDLACCSFCSAACARLSASCMPLLAFCRSSSMDNLLSLSLRTSSRSSSTPASLEAAAGTGPRLTALVWFSSSAACSRSLSRRFSRRRRSSSSVGAAAACDCRMASMAAS